MEDWFKIECYHCHTVNWVCNCHSLYDVEVVKCHKCKKDFWVDLKLSEEVNGCDLYPDPEKTDISYYSADGMTAPN